MKNFRLRFKNWFKEKRDSFYFRCFSFFLKDYIVHMDQWERFEVKTSKGKAYVTISWANDGYRYDKFN